MIPNAVSVTKDVFMIPNAVSVTRMSSCFPMLFQLLGCLHDSQCCFSY